MNKIIVTLIWAAYLVGGPNIKAQELSRNIMLESAKKYLGREYVASTLEVQGPEQLVVDTNHVDCTTFVEYVLAESLTKSNGRGFEDNLAMVRYKDGEIDGYTSRLHYITAWAENGVRNNLIDDITAEHSSHSMKVELSFMSTHPHLYSKLKDSKQNTEKMADIESSLNGKYVAWLPKQEIEDHGAEWIKDGDIIAFTTSVEGLDVSHLGLAIYVDNKLCLLHASSSKGSVVISSLSIKQMFAYNKNWSGIRVFRLKVL